MKKIQGISLASTGFVITISGILFLGDYKILHYAVLCIGVLLIVFGVCKEWRKSKIFNKP